MKRPEWRFLFVRLVSGARCRMAQATQRVGLSDMEGRKVKNPASLLKQGFYIGAQERTRTSTELPAST
jgi:hypothetical protein